jgi:hypothetical protein
MTYSDLIDDEGIKSNYLVILRPRRIVESFALYSGSVYSVSFDYGHVYSVTQDGVSLTEFSTTSLSAGQWYFDFDSETLYVRMSDSSNPSTKTVVVTYEIHAGTTDSHWYRIPTDNSSRVVYFDPIVKVAPALKQTTSDILFGYLPVQTGSISLINAEHTLEKHIYDSSFSNAQILVYHWLDELTVSNTKLVYNGLCSDLSWNQDSVKIKTFDRVDALSNEWRNATNNFYTTALFSELDSRKSGKPIRYVYGVVDGFVPVNVDYKSYRDAPTTSDNRVFSCIAQTGLSDLSRTVAASPSSTTTRTYLNDAKGFRVGDSVWFDRASGTDEYKLITYVDYASDFVEHSTLSGGAMVSGDNLKRSFVGKVSIIQQDVVYDAMFGRDYTTTVDISGSGASGFTFSSSLESNLSMPATLTGNDRIYCRIYGKANDVTLSASPVGSDDSETNNLTNPVVVLVDILKRVALVSESDMNISSFTSLASSVTEGVGFAVPDRSNEAFKTIKDVLIQVLKSSFLRLFLDDDGKWKITQLGPMGSYDKLIEDDEILDGSIEAAYKYKDIVSDVVVTYAYREIPDDISAESDENTQSVVSTSTVAKYLHGVNKSKEFSSIHFRSADAQVMADRLMYVLGDRENEIAIETKNRFFDTEISDIIQVSRTRMPGFDYDSDILRDRKFSVVETSKTLREISITLSDQKGVEDNSGSW